MEIKNEYYLPVEIVFNLLCACKKGYGNNPKKLRAYLHPKNIWSPILPQHLPIPRVSFWIRLCKAALLIDESDHLWPTFFAEEWLSWPLEKQIKHLVKAWVKSSKTEKYKLIRQCLIENIVNGNTLNKTQQKELKRLRVFNIFEIEKNGYSGWEFFHEQFSQEKKYPENTTWKIEMDQLNIPYPPDWKQLFYLEFYLDRRFVGKYTIDKTSLQKAATRGALENNPNLIDIIEKGAQLSSLSECLEKLYELKKIRIHNGLILEFSTPDDLRDTFHKRSLIKDNCQIISPRYILLDHVEGFSILKKLYKAQLISEIDWSAIIPSQDSCIWKLPSLSVSDHLYLLSLLLFIEKSNKNFYPPPGLVEKITMGLDLDSQLLALKKANSLLKKTKENPVQRKFFDIPVNKIDEDQIEVIKKAIETSESIKVLYHSFGSAKGEERTISPLLIEKRKIHQYLVAYCHQRKANRTFRLDRLQLI